MSNLFGPETGPVDKIVPTRADPAGTGQAQQDAIDEAPAPDAGHPSTLLPKASRDEAPLLQFPPVAGQPGVEVAERSADVTTGRTRKHRKVFRVFIPEGVEAFDSLGFDHAANRIATRQYMTSHGLRPIGDVSLASREPYDDRNIDLVYEVEAIPAAIATDPAQANVVVSTD